MGRQESNQPEIRRLRRLLRETVRLAEHASLTGSLEKGGRIAIRQYNHIREHLQNTGAIPDGLFQELDEDDSSFDELGIVCGMLEGYLAEDEEILNEGGKNSAKIQVGMVGVKDLEDLKEIGKVIREGLPDFLRKYSQGGVGDSIRVEIERSMEAAEAARELAREAERTAREAEREAREVEREARRAVKDAEREARHAAREAEREARDSGEDEETLSHRQRAREMADLTNQIREVGERLRNTELQDGQRSELIQRLEHLMATLQQIAEAPMGED